MDIYIDFSPLNFTTIYSFAEYGVKNFKLKVDCKQCGHDSLIKDPDNSFYFQLSTEVKAFFMTKEAILSARMNTRGYDVVLHDEDN